MGIVMLKMIQLGEYCDCLQNWKKYDIPTETNTQSNLFMTQNQSNLDLPIERAFQPQKIDSGLDKQLQLMHERLKKRKKLKAQYLKQKERQIKQKSKEQQLKEKQQIQKIERQQRLWLKQQQLRQQKQSQKERLRKQRQQKKIRANKRNKRIRQKNDQRPDLLRVKLNNKSLSTTDQNILRVEGILQYSKPKGEWEGAKTNKNINVTKKPQQQTEQKDQDLQSQLFDKKPQQGTQIEIIDLQKLNPTQLKEQISQMLINQLKEKPDRFMSSQTVPLHPAIHSHRVSNAKNYKYREDHLRFKEKQGDFETDVASFGDGGLHSTIIEKQSNNYFLDEEDKQEYLQEIFP